jgi:hypothetical protein
MNTPPTHLINKSLVHRNIVECYFERSVDVYNPDQINWVSEKVMMLPEVE